MRCQCHTLQLLDIFQRMLPSHASQFEGCNMASILKAKQLSNHRPFVGTISAKLTTLWEGFQPPNRKDIIDIDIKRPADKWAKTPA